MMNIIVDESINEIKFVNLYFWSFVWFASLAMSDAARRSQTQPTQRDVVDAAGRCWCSLTQLTQLLRVLAYFKQRALVFMWHFRMSRLGPVYNWSCVAVTWFDLASDWSIIDRILESSRQFSKKSKREIHLGSREFRLQKRLACLREYKHVLFVIVLYIVCLLNVRGFGLEFQQLSVRRESGMTLHFIFQCLIDRLRFRATVSSLVSPTRIRDVHVFCLFHGVCVDIRLVRITSIVVFRVW